MEIRTKQEPREQPDSEPSPTPEKGRYLRRKTTQKLRKSRGPSRGFMSALKLIGRLVFTACLLGMVISILTYAYTSDRFSLRNLTVTGCNRLDPQLLERIVRREFGGNVIRLDLKRLRRRIEQEAWVKRAEIRRILPCDIVVSIEERTPAAVLQINENLMLADADGVLLDSYDAKYGKLDVPVFKGTLGESTGDYRLYQEENAARVRLGVAMLRELASGPPAFARSISEVDLSDKTNLRLLLVDDTAEVSLGDKDFLKRFQMFISNITQYQELKSQYSEIVSVDLRFDGQIVYRPRHAAAISHQ